MKDTCIFKDCPIAKRLKVKKPEECFNFIEGWWTPQGKKEPTIIKDLIQFMADNGAYGSGISSFGCTTYGLVEGVENAKKLENKTKQFLNKNGGGKVKT